MKVLKYKWLGLGLLIILAYFILRIPHLTSQPIFVDEAIYIRWAQVMRAEPTLRFLPLSDGKTPLFMWAMIPFFKIFKDPLVAGRMLSVMAGFTILSGIFAISWRIFGKRVALWSVLLYAIIPYDVFFNRMALVDTTLAAFSTWSLYFAIWLLQKPRLDLAMILGYFLGGAWLTKTPAFANLIALPFTMIGFNFKSKKMVKLIIFWGVAIGIALVMYNSLRLGPNFDELSKRNNDYIFSVQELARRPWDPFIPHVIDLAMWFPPLVTWPVLILIFVGIGFVIRDKNKLGLAVLFWILIPLLLLTFFLKTFTARYLLISKPSLLIFAGFGIESLIGILMKYKKLKISRIFWEIIFFVLSLPLALYFDYLILTNLPAAPLPIEERKGYLEDWTAGYGFSEIAQFLISQQQKGPIIVGTEGYFGTLPDGLEIYLDKSGIPIVGGSSYISSDLRKAAVNNTVYFIGNKNRVGIRLENVKLIKEYKKAVPLDGGPQDSIVVYQVYP